MPNTSTQRAIEERRKARQSIALNSPTSTITDHVTASSNNNMKLSEIASKYNNQLLASLGPRPTVPAIGTHTNSNQCESNSFYGDDDNVCYDELSEAAKNKLIYKNNKGCPGSLMKLVERLRANCNPESGGRLRKRSIRKSRRRQNRRKMKTRRRRM